MRPLIGIPISAAAPDAGSDDSGMDPRIRRAVAAAGGLATAVQRRGEAASAVAPLDGLLIPGGPDFLPSRTYPTSVRFDVAPPERIVFDGDLLDAAVRADLPVFGICYGMQLLALRGGGCLHYDLPTDVPSAAAHELPEPADRHELRVEADTLLARILGAGTRTVNSRHHQAVARIGPDLRVCADSPDGIVEAVEGLGRRFHLGVQWHPERMEEVHGDAIFSAFVTACDARRRPSTGDDAV